jgi:hypothetical protein
MHYLPRQAKPIKEKHVLSEAIMDHLVRMINCLVARTQIHPPRPQENKREQ